MKKCDNYIPLPDISGIKFVKAEPEDLVNITRLAKRAVFAAQVDEEKRTTSEKMHITSWNLTWRCFKRTRPGIVKLLKDPIVLDFINMMDGEVRIKL